MSLPFSFVGSFIYLVYVAIVLLVIALPISRWLLNDKPWKWWVIIIIVTPLIAAPIAEELWIKSQFETLCKDAGIHVKRKVEVEGYYDASKNDSSTSNKSFDDPKAIERLRKTGFRFIERRTRQNKIRHLEVKGEMFVQTILDKPQARYHLRHTHDHFMIGHQLEKFERDIFDSLKNEVISRDTSYARYTSWIEGLWVRYIGSGQQICRGPLDEPEKQSRIVPFLTRSIAPINAILDN